MPSEHDSQYLTARDLANRWQTSTGRLANMRSSRTGPQYLKIGSAVRYSLAVVIEHENANTITTEGAA